MIHDNDRKELTIDDYKILYNKITKKILNESSF